MKRALLLLLLVLPLQPAASRYDRLPPQKKIDLIEKGKIPPGTQVVFQQKELNAFLAVRAKEVVPDGLRDTRLEIGNGKVTGYAMVDFVKMRQARGQELNWLMSKMLEGEHPITVTGRIESNRGIARVDIERVDIGGSVIEGRALDLLIRTFVNPLYPQAKVGKDFELGYNMDRIELHPGTARVVMAPKESLQASR